MIVMPYVLGHMAFLFMKSVTMELFLMVLWAYIKKICDAGNKKRGNIWHYLNIFNTPKKTLVSRQ